MAHPRRRRGRGPARRAADQGPHRAGAAHRARPGGLVDPVGAGGGRQAALGGAPARARRRRPGDRHRPGLRPGLRRAAAPDHRASRRPSCSPTRRRRRRRSRRSPTSDERWMVAVRMVSEGVDVPRLAVGVYATTTSTPLFFAQAVGRFVRARNRGETASVFLPSVPALLGFASELEVRARPRAGPQGSPTRATSSPPRTTCSPRRTPARRPRRRAGRAFEALGSEARVGRVAELDLVVEHDPVGVVGDLGLVAELDRLAEPALEDRAGIGVVQADQPGRASGVAAGQAGAGWADHLAGAPDGGLQVVHQPGQLPAGLVAGAASARRALRRPGRRRPLPARPGRPAPR